MYKEDKNEEDDKDEVGRKLELFLRLFFFSGKTVHIFKPSQNIGTEDLSLMDAKKMLNYLAKQLCLRF